MGYKVVNVDLPVRGRVISVNPKTKGYQVAWDMRNLKKGFSAMCQDLKTLDRKHLIVPNDSEGGSYHNEFTASGRSVYNSYDTGGNFGNSWSLSMKMIGKALAFVYNRAHWTSFSDSQYSRELQFSPTGVFSDDSHEAESGGSSIYGGPRPDHRQEDTIRVPLQAIIFEKKGYSNEKWNFWLVVNPAAYARVKRLAKGMSWVGVAPRGRARSIFTGKPNRTLQIHGIKVFEEAKMSGEEYINWSANM